MRLAETVGFSEVNLHLSVRVGSPVEAPTWEEVLRTAANPKIPCLGDAPTQTLAADEAARFRAHLEVAILRSKRGVPV